MTPVHEVCRRAVERPFFSVCIPHHNRTSFLLAVCRSLDAQHYRDFELCISDDCSTDGRQDELLEFLRSSNLSFVYRRLDRNVRYDGNLRSAIQLASGRYCFLLGNDDALESPTTLGELQAIIAASPEPAVVLTNFEDYATGHVTRRVRSTAIVGAGPAVAAGKFRKFSFVGGVVLKTEPAQAEGNNPWDGSEMHQMFVGCRLIAAGGLLLEVDLVTVRKDVEITGEVVDSFARKPLASLRGIPAQHLPFGNIGRLVIDAVDPYIEKGRSRIVLNVLTQYLGFLYPYWLVQYRKVQSWRYAAGISKGMRPGMSLSTIKLSPLERIIAHGVFSVATVVGLTVPIWLLEWLQRPARAVVHRIGEWGVTPSRT